MARSPFAHLLRRQRLARGLTQQELAERARLSERAISDLERGVKKAPRLTTVRLLVEALRLEGAEAVALRAAALRSHAEDLDPREDLPDAGPNASPRPVAPPIGRTAEMAVLRQRMGPTQSRLALPGPHLMAPRPVPHPLASFVGREDELTSIAELLARPDVRLLTLTGAGGSGKTRTAFEAARRLGSAYADGIALVDLAPLTRPDLVAAAIVQSLGLPNDLREEGLLDVLRDRQLLLLLDNFEHVLDATALVVSMLSVSPGLRILITSRTVLGASFEHVFRIEPLPNEDAVRLFVERAQAADSGLVMSPREMTAVVEICHRLDGLPLAIELAAARVRLLPPAALLARLDRRLPLLAHGGRDRPMRQQTLNNTIGWSYDLLSAVEQRMFRHMAVFRGGWTLEAAAALTDADPSNVLETMTGLVDRSLVESTLSHASSEPRLRMLETVREFGIDCLNSNNESQAAHLQHAMYFVHLAQTAAPNLRGPERAHWFTRLDVESDNFRAALLFTLESTEGVVLGLRLASALHLFWEERGYWTEGRAWLERLIDRAGGYGVDTPLLAKALTCAGNLAYFQNDLSAARQHLERSVELLRSDTPTTGLVSTLRMLARIAIGAGDFAVARQMCEEGLRLAATLNLPLEIALGYNVLGRAFQRQGRLSEATEYLERGLTVMRELKDLSGSALLLWALGETAEQQGDVEAAHDRFEAGLMLSRQAGDRKELARCLIGLARVATRRPGDIAAAQRMAAESVQLFRDMGAPGELDEALRVAALLDRPSVQNGAVSALLPDGLTVREAEIIRLMARGVSNSTIASTLVLSVRTVERHIENVYGKLGVHGRSARAAVAAYAVRTGLADAATVGKVRVPGDNNYASARMRRVR